MQTPVCDPRSTLVRNWTIAGAVLACLSLVSMTAGAYAESVAPVGVLITPFAVAINPSTHKVFAVNEAEGTVSVTDELSSVTKSVKVGEGPIAIAVNHVTGRVYVLNAESGSLSVLDGNGDSVIATVKIQSNPYVLAVNETSNKVYVANTYSNTVTVIDGTTNAVTDLKVG
jgi:YVTN family beta-propeller protein